MMFSFIKNPHSFAFDAVVIFAQILYIAVFLNLVFINTEWIDYLNIGVQIFVVSFLLYRFRKDRPVLSNFDSKIVRYSAYFILFNLLITEIVRKFEFLKPYVPKNILNEILTYISKHINNATPTPTPTGMMQA